MQSFLNVNTLQTYTFFKTLTPRLHGRSKRFFRRPQNLNAPRKSEHKDTALHRAIPLVTSLKLFEYMCTLCTLKWTNDTVSFDTDVLEAVPLYTKKTQGGSGSTAPLILGTCDRCTFWHQCVPMTVTMANGEAELQRAMIKWASACRERGMEINASKE